MKWKTVGKIAMWTAIAVVPGAAGYAAYRYVVRPWLDNHTAKKTAETPPPETPAPRRRRKRRKQKPKKKS